MSKNGIDLLVVVIVFIIAFIAGHRVGIEQGREDVRHCIAIPMAGAK